MQAHIYRTEYEKQTVTTQNEPLEIVPDTGKQELNVVNVYPEVEDQLIEGFGGAITEAVGHTLEKMSEQNVAEILGECFGKSGLNYQMTRTHLDSCDFSLGNYSAAENEEDIKSGELSYKHDEQYIIPYIKQAGKIRGEELPVMLTPWSPPAFMKTNEDRNGGGKLKKEYYQMWAEYIAGYIQQYKSEGLYVDKLSVQNEPNAVQTWDSCIFSAAEEKEFLSGYLYPILKREGLEDIGIYVWDHNKERIFDRTNQLLDKNTKDMVAGIAFHWYSGDHFDGVKLVHEQFPEKKLLFSEGCIEYSRFDTENQLHNARMYAHDMIGNFNAGMSTFIDWNIVLDEIGGPNHVGNYCEAPIICDTKNDTFDKKLSYYYIGHFSRYIKPGARRIATTKYSDDIDVLAVRNPDEQLNVILLNRTDKEQELYIRLNGILVPVNLRKDSIATVVLNN